MKQKTETNISTVWRGRASGPLSSWLIVVPPFCMFSTKKIIKILVKELLLNYFTEQPSISSSTNRVYGGNYQCCEQFVSLQLNSLTYYLPKVPCIKMAQ